MVIDHYFLTVIISALLLSAKTLHSCFSQVGYPKNQRCRRQYLLPKKRQSCMESLLLSRVKIASGSHSKCSLARASTPTVFGRVPERKLSMNYRTFFLIIMLIIICQTASTQSVSFSLHRIAVPCSTSLPYIGWQSEFEDVLDTTINLFNFLSKVPSVF